MSASWHDTLSELEARLDAIAAALELAEIPPEYDFVVPAVREPLPPELRDRAAEVIDRGAALQARLQAEAEQVAAELRRLPRRRATSTGTGLFEVNA